jgi:hypothetical protein
MWTAVVAVRGGVPRPLFGATCRAKSAPRPSVGGASDDSFVAKTVVDQECGSVTFRCSGDRAARNARASNA